MKKYTLVITSPYFVESGIIMTHFDELKELGKVLQQQINYHPTMEYLKEKLDILVSNVNAVVNKDVEENTFKRYLAVALNRFLKGEIRETKLFLFDNTSTTYPEFVSYS